ncbi:hypothetical protein PHLGIDRAFT_127540 [Phlebiopsis gigantea 11061_1 CR5-6]|uniref:C3H1-type domain-containing protein n=1 Tax=Phlebiopsis gigantea (strain 11061_1 CR5-6) TaxID=745531 RepID=A0A0C3PLX9_PHLG1|nr:hypothetical protein PHLGIDRAFT_127540 [Phlebiopsis gigantea 11061_1 CR5-6]
MSTPSDISTRLVQRTVQRNKTRDDKRKQADQYKDEGNQFFREGQYEDAVECYERAITTYGPRLVYLNNLAAAYLKVERFGDAEYAAEHALMRDPKLDKARYRRALARKGEERYKAAATDLIIVIRRDPKCVEAIRELDAIRAIVDVDSPEYDGEDGDEQADTLGYPYPDEDVLDFGEETAFLSDSSDFAHDGNGIPCRFYNHDGCRSGSGCKFKHAPDDRSIRDNLGRNVCLFHVYGGICKFPAADCVYTHDTTQLPKGPWSEPRTSEPACRMIASPNIRHSAQRLEDFAPILKSTQPIESYSFLPHVHAAELLVAGLSMLPEDNDTGPVRRGSDRPKGKGKKRGKGKGRGKARGSQSTRSPYEEDSDFERDMDKRAMNCGFTNDEVFELMCQGVKPWDDDAWDVMHALQSF